MKIIKNTFLVLMTVLFFACDSDDYSGDAPDPVQTQLKVIGRGASVAQLKTIMNPDNGQPVEAFCFLMDLVDSKTGEIIGTLEDCDMGTTENPDGTLISKIVTKFNFTGKGSITSRGDVLQRPIGEGKFSTEFTPTEINIVAVTDDFLGLEGKTTLVGEVDLTRFDQDIIIFNCNFTIDLESK